MDITAADQAQLFLSMPLQPGSGGLVPVALWADEAISHAFSFTVELRSQDQTIQPVDMLYQPACIRLGRPDSLSRYFHGMIRRFAFQGAAGRDYFTYTVELAPRFWFMRQTEDCRVFQAQSAKDILQTLLTEAGITSAQFKISGTPTVREYTVQWNETDFAFATRLMEEEGYFYFFEHSASDHVMVIADSNQAFVALASPDVSLDPVSAEISALRSWEPAMETAWGAVTLQDYDPTAPDTNLQATQKTLQKAAGASQRDVYHWPALTFDAGEVQQRARRRIEAAEANDCLTEGTGVHEGFVPGAKFTLDLDPQSGDKNKEYVIRSVYHQATSEAFAAGGGEASYANRFTAFPSSQTWREIPTMEHPRMNGLFSAVVIGPDGEEIYPDKYGRVKVLFPWDHRKDSTAGKSVWLRVVQPWAGKTWGWQHIPRVGTEVAVAFMDGDVDRPVVVGGLYNADYMPPFALPDQKTKTGLRTRSTLNGGTSNFSEFSIDDKMGSELVFLHAEKDHTIEVEHDQNLTVDNCRIKKVGADETVTIGGNQSIKIGPFDPTKSGGDQTVEIWNSRSVTIDQSNDALLLKQGDLSTKLSMGNMSTTLSMGDMSTKLSMGNMTVELSLGNLSTKADVGKIDENALQSITMTVGANSIKIDQTGVTISGIMVKLQGQAMTQVQAPMIQVSADAMLMAKGGIVMIN